MHTQDFNYTQDDLRFSNDPRINHVNGRTLFFHYNSDLSGEVLISVGDTEEEIRIPGWMLIEFVGRHFVSELIGKIEQMSGQQLLELLVP